MLQVPGNVLRSVRMPHHAGYATAPLLASGNGEGVAAGAGTRQSREVRPWPAVWWLRVMCPACLHRQSASRRSM